MKKIFELNLLGYGFAINYIGYNGQNDGSLQRYGVGYENTKYMNPYLTFFIEHRWLTFKLLLNKE